MSVILSCYYYYLHYYEFSYVKVGSMCLQCLDTVGWAPRRASGLKNLNGEVLAWLSVWSEVQMLFIWSS